MSQHSEAVELAYKRGEKKGTLVDYLINQGVYGESSRAALMNWPHEDLVRAAAEVKVDAQALADWIWDHPW